MKKIVLSSILAVALSQTYALAEESRAFVGVGVGYGGTQLKAEVTGGPTYSLNGGGISAEVIAGYKQFFTPEFGLRYYANFAYNDSPFTENGATTNGIFVFNYGVNVDALYNFISNETLDFGVLLGLGLGANTWGGIDNRKLSTTGFDLGLNVGVRTSIAKHHGIEVLARVPFIATTLLNESQEGISTKLSIARQYSVGVRYIFSF